MDHELESGPEAVHLDRGREGHPPIPLEMFREDLWRRTLAGLDRRTVRVVDEEVGACFLRFRCYVRNVMSGGERIDGSTVEIMWSTAPPGRRGRAAAACGWPMSAADVHRLAPRRRRHPARLAALDRAFLEFITSWNCAEPGSPARWDSACGIVPGHRRSRPRGSRVRGFESLRFRSPGVLG
jgi:hypothetical protein